MKKLFISQPMKDKTNDEIERARERAIREATEYIGEPVEIIDSFFKDAPHDAKPLWFLAESIRLMADADLVYFAKGWKDARGCMIERECAVQYGVPAPAMTAALSYFDGYTTDRLPANLLQAQRDYFGAHTYERLDSPRGQFFHTNWTGHSGNTAASTYNA